jgi:hypothetical protein
MTKFRLVVSLLTKDNDYQGEQAASARSAAAELGVDLDILYGENDGITQSTQLLKLIQSEPALRPHGLIVEPCGATSLSKVASAAAGAGWDGRFLTARRTIPKACERPLAAPSFQSAQIRRKSEGFRGTRLRFSYQRVGRFCTSRGLR